MVFLSGCAHMSVADRDIPTAIPGESLEMHFGVARLMERNGEIEDSREAYTKILEKRVHGPSLHRLAVTSVKLGRIEEALHFFDRAISVSEPSAQLFGDLGFAQYLSGDFTNAEASLQKAVSLDGNQKRNINNLAIVIGCQNRLSEAWQLFRQVNNEPEALCNLAYVKVQLNDLASARSIYSRALTIDPNLKIAAHGLFEVQKHLPLDAQSKSLKGSIGSQSDPGIQRSFSDSAQSVSQQSLSPLQ